MSGSARTQTRSLQRSARVRTQAGAYARHMRCAVLVLLAGIACGPSTTPPPAAPQLAPTPEIQSPSPSSEASEPSARAAQALAAPAGDARAQLIAGMARYDQMLRAMDGHGL